MKGLTLVLLAVSAGAIEPDVVGVYPADVRPDAQFAEDIEVVLDETISTDGHGSLKVTYRGAGAAEAMLFDQELSGVDDAMLWYEADIRCAEPGGMAYAALWMVFPDGSRYFSRGLDQRCAPDWRRVRIPFRLEKGQRPDRVLMGVRFEGPGTVWLDNARLVKCGLGAAYGRTTNLAGAVVGLSAGLWGVLAGFLVPRGKGKRLVMGSGAAFLFLGIAVLGAGVGLLALGYVGSVWRPMVVLGIVATALFPWLLVVVARRYRDFEFQRLASQDASDSL